MTIDDKTDGKIYHYDTLGKLVVTECGYACYYECGTTAYAEATKGKIVAKKGGEISVLYAIASKDSNNKDVAAVAAVEDGGKINEAYCVESADASGESYTTFSTSKEGNVTFKYKDEEENNLTTADIKAEGQKNLVETRTEESSKSPIAKENYGCINVNTGKSYSLDEEGFRLAVSEMNSGDKIILLNDLSITNSSVKFTKDFILDLNGKTITDCYEDGSNYDGMFNCADISFEIIGNNGKMEISDSNENCFSLISTGSNSVKSNISIKLSDLTISGTTKCGQILDFRQYASSSYSKNIILNNVNANIQTTANASNGNYGDNAVLMTFSSANVSVNGGVFTFMSIDKRKVFSLSNNSTLVCNNSNFATNVVFCENQQSIELNNCTIGYPNGKDWISTVISVSFGGKTNVNDGNYSGQNAIEVWNSGGTVTVSGGTFTASDYAIYAMGGSSDDREPAYVIVNDGTFTGKVKALGSIKEALILIEGGTFNEVSFEEGTTKSNINIIGGKFDVSSDSVLAPYVDLNNCTITKVGEYYEVSIKNSATVLTAASGNKYVVNSSDIDSNGKLMQGNYWIISSDSDIFADYRKCENGQIVEYVDATNAAFEFTCWNNTNYQNISVYCKTLDEAINAYDNLYSASKYESKYIYICNDTTINGNVDIGDHSIEYDYSYGNKTLTVNGEIKSGSFNCNVAATTISGGYFERTVTCPSATGGTYETYKAPTTVIPTDGYKWSGSAWEWTIVIDE